MIILLPEKRRERLHKNKERSELGNKTYVLTNTK